MISRVDFILGWVVLIATAAILFVLPAASEENKWSPGDLLVYIAGCHDEDAAIRAVRAYAVSPDRGKATWIQMMAEQRCFQTRSPIAASLIERISGPHKIGDTGKTGSVWLIKDQLGAQEYILLRDRDDLSRSHEKDARSADGHVDVVDRASGRGDLDPLRRGPDEVPALRALALDEAGRLLLPTHRHPVERRVRVPTEALDLRAERLVKQLAFGRRSHLSFKTASESELPEHLAMSLVVREGSMDALVKHDASDPRRIVEPRVDDDLASSVT